MLKSYIRQRWQRYNNFADGSVTQYIHQMGCIYIMVPQDKWNNTTLETTNKLERIGKYCKILSSKQKVGHD